MAEGYIYTNAHICTLILLFLFETLFCENFLCKFSYNSCAKYTECSTHLFVFEYLCVSGGVYVCQCVSCVLNFNWDIKWQALVAAGSLYIAAVAVAASAAAAAFLPFVCNLHNILLNVD